MTDDGAMNSFPENIQRFLARLYAPDRRRYACHVSSADEFAEWQAMAHPVLCSLVGLDRIREQVGDHVSAVVQGKCEDCGDFVRQDCRIDTEPDVSIPFWMLRPKKGGKFPLALTPHGHGGVGRDESAGVAHDEEHARKIAEGDRDVSVQAVRNGFVAIAPATRGLAQGFVTDVFGRFRDRDCTSHFMHGLLAGRTSIGERVWDMQRLMDWASNRNDVDARDILMLGNSGGGVLTTFAAACDKRIGIAVSSCAYSSFVGVNGKIQHHECNAVPGIMNFGEFWDVAGLIAPRHFLAVHGSYDHLKATDEVDRAVRELRTIYKAVDANGRFDQVYGSSGHRFYADLMWPFINQALTERRKLREQSAVGDADKPRP